VTTISYRSVNQPDRYIRHTSFLGVLHPASTTLDKADATFILRQPGLTGAPDTVSFESVNYPGHYLRHRNYRLTLQRDDGTNLFHQDGSFRRRPSLSWDHSNAESLESVNLQGHFIRHQNYELWLAQPGAGSAATFSADASFIHYEARCCQDSWVARSRSHRSVRDETFSY
jgi:hypothetical protein